MPKSRSVLALAAGAAVLAAAPAAADPPQLNLPPVKMKRAVVAAQTDTVRPAGATTPGAKASVKRIQRALRAKGYKRVVVDGRFGLQTMNAYSKWQVRSTGASGLAANGIPGPASLTALGSSRFIVTEKIDIGTSNDAYNGKRVNTRTRRMLEAAAARLGPKCVWPVSQGSYSTSVDASAQTHAGGGAVDIYGTRFCGKGRERARKALVAVGFAAWYRDADEGFGGREHIHAIANGDTDVSTPIYPGGFTAWHQIGAWARGEKGLSTPGAGPIKREPKLWENYTP